MKQITFKTREAIRYFRKLVSELTTATLSGSLKNRHISSPFRNLGLIFHSGKQPNVNLNNYMQNTLFENQEMG